MKNKNKPVQGKRGLFANAVAFLLKLATPLIVIFGSIIVVIFAKKKKKTDKPISPGTNQPSQAPSTTPVSKQPSSTKPQAKNSPAPTHQGPTSSTTASDKTSPNKNNHAKKMENPYANKHKPSTKPIAPPRNLSETMCPKH